jgi:hypothetical protein
MLVSAVILISASTSPPPQLPSSRQGSQFCWFNREQAKEAVYLAEWTRSLEHDGSILLLLKFNFLSWPDAQMLKHILGEGNLAPCGDGQTGHRLVSLLISNSNQKSITGNYRRVSVAPSVW